MQEAKTPVESAIESAKKTCDDGTTQECAAAWDEVRQSYEGLVSEERLYSGGGSREWRHKGVLNAIFGLAGRGAGSQCFTQKGAEGGFPLCSYLN